jgi:hypothetical protein
VAFADPFVHGLIAAAVAAPLAARHGRGPVVTAVVAGTAIDVDHPLAARSLRLTPMVSMAARPRSHSLLSALGVGALAAAMGGPVHGWAAFAGLSSHLLRDAEGLGAPTPLMWPLSSGGRVGRRAAIAGIAVLAVGSLAVSRTAPGGAGPSAGADDGGGGAARPRTA